MNKIERYSIDENGKVKVVMSQNTAKELQLVIKGFEEGQKYACGESYMIELGHYIVEEYLDDESARENILGWIGAEDFAKAVKDKIGKLL